MSNKTKEQKEREVRWWAHFFGGRAVAVLIHYRKELKKYIDS